MLPLQRRQSPARANSGCAKRPRDREAVAPGGGRRGVEADVVRAQAVAHHDVDPGQHQRRRLPLLVDPAHRAAADHELLLLEEPVRGVAAVVGVRVLAAEIEPGDADVAAPASRRMSSAGASISSCSKRGSERQQRARRDRRGDPRQAAARPAARRRGPGRRAARAPAPSRSERTSIAPIFTTAPSRRAGARLDRPTPLLDVRQNQPVSESQPTNSARHDAPNSPRSTRAHGSQAASAARRRAAMRQRDRGEDGKT